MKTKYVLCICSALMILLCIYAFSQIDAIFELQKITLKEMAALDSDSEKILTLIENGGFKKILLFLNGLHLFLSGYIFFNSLNNQILIKKGKMLAASIICTVTSVLSLSLLLAIIEIIMIACAKRKNPEDYPTKEKLKLPIKEFKPLSKGQIVLLLSIVLIYFFSLSLEKIIPDNISKEVLRLISVGYYAGLFILGILCLTTVYLEDIKLFLKNTKAYYQHVLPVVGIMYLAYFSLTMLVMSISGESTSLNQTAIEELPLYITAPLAILWAPIIEELIFRGCLRKVIKKDTVFIILSGLIFGFLHTMSEASLISVVALAVPYSILGVFLAYIYSKTNNISNNILVHAFHNTIAVIILALLKA